MGKVFTITLPFVGRVVDFTDPAVLEHVLKTNFWAYEKGEFTHRTMYDLLGRGIFGADGHVRLFFLRDICKRGNWLI
jgi:hypothetical protein